MATYVIGDIHGCFQEFKQLLEKIEFDASSDHLWQVGDLVNGGPESLATLRWFVEHDELVTVVLGNHDLHLLAVAKKVQKKRHKDNFDDILNARDRSELLDWLRRRPMMVGRGDRVLVHAGLLPEWTIEVATGVAREVEELLAGPNPEQVLGQMYGNRPSCWAKVSTVEERWRVTINAMTRMRVLKSNGDFDFGYKSTYEEVPAGKYAWFDAPNRAWQGHQVICGHWSALGLHHNTDVVALDTGCRWGGKLTALRLDDDEIFQVDSAQTFTQ